MTKKTPKGYRKKFFKYWLLQEVFEYEAYPLAHNIFIANVLRTMLKLPADTDYIKVYRKYLKDRRHLGTCEVQWELTEKEFRKEYMNGSKLCNNNDRGI